MYSPLDYALNTKGAQEEAKQGSPTRQLLENYVCKYADMAIEMGENPAVGALTTALTPEIGPALAAIVAKAIVWLSKHVAGGLKNLVCTFDKVTIGEAIDIATGHRYKAREEAYSPPHAIEDFTTRKGSLPERVPARPLASRILDEQTYGQLATFPLVQHPAATGFTPMPIPVTTVGIEVWPRMDSKKAALYNQKSRYEGTYNGQPHATYPQVGFGRSYR